MVTGQPPPLNEAAPRPAGIDPGNIDSSKIDPSKINNSGAQGIDKIRQILAAVTDPEIPVLGIADLGILRGVQEQGGKYVITITPTYTGCPAMHSIQQDIKAALAVHGVMHYEIITQLSPAWTTDWLTEQGRQKLLAFGIAPPAGKTNDKRLLIGQAVPIRCPRCQSADTLIVSQFGSTACKALYKCQACLEPFDYFKCL